MRIWAAALVLMVSLATVQVASANTLLNLSGSGIWNSDATVTPYSGPSATWQFTFDLPGTIAANPTTEATNFSFLLNGVSVPGNPVNVEFFDAANLGLFDINFAGITVSMLSPNSTDVGSSLTLLPGTYPAGISLNDNGSDGTGSVTIGSAIVPEPSTWVLLATALFMGAGMLYFRKTLSGVAQ